MMETVVQLNRTKANLGEAPYWDVTEQALFFTDMRGQKVWRYTPQSNQVTSWVAPAEAVGVSRAENDRFVAVLADGFYEFDPLEGTFSLITRVPDLQLDEAQLSECKVDPRGRFVAGGASNAAVPLLDLPAAANLLSFAKGQISILDTGYHITNGVCWSPDGSTLYVTDSVPKKIFAYDYDVATCRVGKRRLFADVSQVSGMQEGAFLGGALPDGATVDAEGRVWSAFCGAGSVVCFAPDGSVERVLQTPVTWITSIAFGGPDLDQLYATSMDPTFFGLPADEVSGYLYLIEGHGTRGVAPSIVKLKG